jgi:hypothetical protein
VEADPASTDLMNGKSGTAFLVPDWNKLLCRKPFFFKKNVFENSPEKETEIKTPARQLQGKYFADRRKKEKPSDNHDDDCDDER